MRMRQLWTEQPLGELEKEYRQYFLESRQKNIHNRDYCLAVPYLRFHHN